MKDRTWLVVGVALVALLLGAILLKGLAKDGPSDPTASSRNGAPQGLLALALWLEGRGVEVARRHGFEEELPTGPSLLVVPPPEGSAWTDAEVEAVLARVREGDVHVVVLCDEAAQRRQKLSAWLDALDVGCVPVEAQERRASGTLPRFAHALFVRGGGRVQPATEAASVPAWLDEEGHVVVTRERIGEGTVTVVGSATVVSNDGLAEAENAAFFLGLLVAGASVVFDEAHHTFRSTSVLDEAFSGPGATVAAIALLLLVPAVLLGFAPRRGDPPPAPPADAFLAARSSAEALAALYLHAGVPLPERSDEDPPPLEPRARSRRVA